VAPPVSPGTAIYNESLDAYLKDDQETAYALAAKARAMEPGLVEAQRMMERIKPVPHNVTKVSTDTYNESLNAYLANDKEKALNLAHKALIQDRRNTEALRMVERLTNAGGLTTPAPVAAPPPAIKPELTSKPQPTALQEMARIAARNGLAGFRQLRDAAMPNISTPETAIKSLIPGFHEAS
jgi:hypothetical protein